MMIWYTIVSINCINLIKFNEVRIIVVKLIHNADFYHKKRITNIYNPHSIDTHINK